MGSINIFTANRIETNFQYFSQLTCPALNEPVVYLIPTDTCSTDTVSSFQKLLPVHEQAKALKFRFLKDQHSYIITHAMLRTILGSYLGTEPCEIEFVSNDYGKPALSEKHKKIHFNLSHSSGLSVLAFSTKTEIGVDVEKIDPGFDFDLIAKAHFSEEEKKFLHTNHGESCKRFYTVWTRKEALLKAIGIGIGENLGIEVFRRVNQYRPETPFPQHDGADYYLDTFEFQDKYLITTASNDSDRFVGLVHSIDKRT